MTDEANTGPSRTESVPDADMGEVSDGYHTFNELYEHRHWLFLALACWNGGWAARAHADGTKIEGWFIAGMTLAQVGDITYHLPDRLWPVVEALGMVVEAAPEWDGHASQDVVARLGEWVGRNGGRGC